MMIATDPAPMRQRQAGFTLIEMAMVLMIVALLLGGLLPTISSQAEQRHENDTRKQLDEIQQALIGFAIINGRLPCHFHQQWRRKPGRRRQLHDFLQWLCSRRDTGPV